MGKYICMQIDTSFDVRAIWHWFWGLTSSFADVQEDIDTNDVQNYIDFADVQNDDGYD